MRGLLPLTTPTPRALGRSWLSWPQPGPGVGLAAPDPVPRSLLWALGDADGAAGLDHLCSFLCSWLRPAGLSRERVGVPAPSALACVCTPGSSPRVPQAGPHGGCVGSGTRPFAGGPDVTLSQHPGARVLWEQKAGLGGLGGSGPGQEVEGRAVVRQSPPRGPGNPTSLVSVCPSASGLVQVT